MIEARINEEEIFKIAHEIASPQTRNAYLEQVCGDDVALHQRVLALLQVVEQEQSFLERPAAAPVETVPPSPLREKSGDTIGPYKLLEQIGEGGMGLVYMAQQTQPVKRKVALKVIKPGMDSKQVIARFEAERQALAMMDHPHIARVLDAGTTESSRPYFVMELVRGMPITDYCDKQRINTRERLKLFLDVCHAVQHAHLKGIIHRDLKPSNVLITLHDGTAVVKVIDFGVAKALNQELTEKTLFTQFSQMVGTPLYMSPEQAELSGLDVDTRTDVYSLGVLLYELLTGTTPFDKELLKSAGFDEMRRIIREDEPPRPSTRISTVRAAGESTAAGTRGSDPRQLSRLLRGEIDWIVMKALEKDRSRRYETASSLAADIQRYLSDEPVLACPPTTMYRFHKFARKHKPTLATAAAIALCMILGTTVSAWQAVRATTAEAQATANEQKAIANEQKANANAAQAQDKAQEATTQRDEAQKQRDEVLALNEKLQATQAELRAMLYAAHINQAQQAWEGGGIERMQELLAQHLPKPGESDLRGFEWHYLQRLSHSELLTLEGHAGNVRVVAYSPDGKWLASGSQDNKVKIWDAQTGQELFTCAGHTGVVSSVAYSPDGKRLASGSADHTVKVWDAQTGQEIRSLKHIGLVQEVAFSPNGNRLAAGSWSQNSMVKVWDTETGQELLSLKGGNGRVAFSPDGKRLASGPQAQRDREVRTLVSKVWDAESGQEVFSLNCSFGDLVAFSPDGKRLATVEKVWNAATGEELFTINGRFRFAFSPDGKQLAAAVDDKTVKLWDAQTGKELLTLQGHSRAIGSIPYSLPSAIRFSPDGRYVASAQDVVVTVWDAQTGRQIVTHLGHTSLVTAIAFSPDGKHLASASRDQTVKVWDALASPKHSVLKGHTDDISRVSFSPDGKRLVSGSVDKTAKVWDTRTGEELLTFKGHTKGVKSVVFSPDGKRVASSSGDKTAKIWDAQIGQELFTFQGISGGGVAFSPDGQLFASPSNDKTLKVWNARTGQEHLSLQNDGQFVAFSPDGKRLASDSADKLVRVWDVGTRQLLLTLKGHTAGLGQVVFSPDGQRLASTSDDKTVKVWDAQTGRELLSLKHFSKVWAMTISPDGNRLASGTETGEVKVWNAQTGQELLTFSGHTYSVDGLAFSPDGHFLASDGNDNTVIIWDATPLPEKP